MEIATLIAATTQRQIGYVIAAIVLIAMVTYWLFNRSPETTHKWLDQKFESRPDLAEANKLALKAGIEYGRAAELFQTVYEVPPATLALVVFRCTHGQDLAGQNDLNERIRDRVNASGRAFLTHTVLDGRVVLRLSIGNIKTSQAEVDDVWAALREAAEAEEP